MENVNRPQASGYSEAGASRVRRALKGFKAVSSSPNEDINWNNYTMRQRARMLYMSSPVAASAIKTNRTKVVGTGLTLKASIEHNAFSLSGGNQQKVVIAKWIMASPKLLIMDEPTRGVDVGAKAEIYTLMCKFAAQGMAIIMVSSELPEVMGMSDRVLVYHEGHISGEFHRKEIVSGEVTQEVILSSAFGVS